MQRNPTDIFIHYLQQLNLIVEKIATHQQHNPALLYTSLHNDMLPLLAQVRTAANFALRTCCPLAKRERISFDNPQETYAGLQQQLDETIAYLQAIPTPEFDQSPARVRIKRALTNWI